MSKGSNTVVDKELNDAVIKQAEQISKIQTNIDKILAANQELRNARDLQTEIESFKENNQPPVSKFKKMIQSIPSVKSLFVKTTQEKITEKIKQNYKILADIDKSLVEMGEKSSTLQRAIKEELAIGSFKLKEKLTKGLTSEVPDHIKDTLNELNLSPKKWNEAVSEVYNSSELTELENQNKELNGIKSNLNKFLDDNKNISQYKPLKEELNTAQSQLKKSFGEHIKGAFSKIKGVFKDSNLQKLDKNATKNIEKLDSIGQGLDTALGKIEKSHKNRQEKLKKELKKLAPKLDSDKLAKGVALLKQVEDLDKKFMEAIEKAGHTTSPTPDIDKLKVGETLPPVTTPTTPPPAYDKIAPPLGASVPPPPPPPPGDLFGSKDETKKEPTVTPGASVPPPPPPPLAGLFGKKETEVEPTVTPGASVPPPPPPPPAGLFGKKETEVETAVTPGASVPPPPPPPLAGLFGKKETKVEPTVTPGASVPPPPPPPPADLSAGAPPPPPPLAGLFGKKETEVETAVTPGASVPPAKVEQPEALNDRDKMLAQIRDISNKKKLKPIEKPITEEEKWEKLTKAKDNLFADPLFQQRINAIVHASPDELEAPNIAEDLTKNFKKILGPNVIIDSIDTSDFVNNDKDRITLKYVQPLKEQAQQIAGEVLSKSGTNVSIDSEKTLEQTIREAGVAMRNSKNQSTPLADDHTRKSRQSKGNSLG